MTKKIGAIIGWDNRSLERLNMIAWKENERKKERNTYCKTKNNNCKLLPKNRNSDFSLFNFKIALLS